jgi:drug/metabolite transporter (DMT)-like permease
MAISGIVYRNWLLSCVGKCNVWISSNYFLKMFKIFILGTIWGTSFAVARLAISHGINPIIYSLLLVAIPACIMTGYCWYTKKIANLFTNNLPYYCIAGLFGIVIPNTTKYFLAVYLPSGILAIIVATTPFFIYLLAILCKEELFKWQRLVGILSGGIGIILLAINHTRFGNISLNGWLLLSLIIPGSYAACAVYVVKHQPKNHNLVSLTTGMLIVSTLCLIPLVFLASNNISLTSLLTIKMDLTIVIQSLLVIIGYILLFDILTTHGSVNYSVVDGISGVVGLLLGWSFFHETLTINTTWAIIMILFGAWLINITKPSRD